MFYKPMPPEEREILLEGLGIAMSHIRDRIAALPTANLTYCEKEVLEGRYKDTLKELEVVYKKLKGG